MGSSIQVSWILLSERIDIAVNHLPVAPPGGCGWGGVLEGKRHRYDWKFWNEEEGSETARGHNTSTRLQFPDYDTQTPLRMVVVPVIYNGDWLSPSRKQMAIASRNTIPTQYAIIISGTWNTGVNHWGNKAGTLKIGCNKLMCARPPIFLKVNMLIYIYIHRWAC